jgi:glycosyltransferase involved in cell wall biosynthesis
MKEIIIVGSFIKRQNGATGGVLFASSSIVESSLSDTIVWHKIDTTAKLPIQNIIIRGYKAFVRVVKFIWTIITKKKITSALIFTSDGVSFLEKGLMVQIGSLFGKKTILAPRSGYIIKQLENKYFRKYASLVFSKANIVVCQGTNWKQLFESLVSEKKKSNFVVIPNWVDSSLYNLPRLSDSRNNHNIKLLYLGWITKDKGVFDLIEAIKLIRLQVPNLKVIMCGDGDDRIELEDIIERQGLASYFTFRGWVKHEEKLELLANCDFFVLPSHAEGFPNSVLEAMASGLPIITTKVGAVEDLVNDTNGILVDSHDVISLSSAILQLYENDGLRNELGLNAQKRVASNFDISSAITSFKKYL